MSNEDYKPRFSFEISEEQKFRVERLLDAHGVKKALFGIILDDVLDKIELHGDKFIVAMTSQVIHPSEILPSIKRSSELIEELGERNE